MARRMGAGPQSRWAGSAFGVEAGLFLAATLAAFGQGSNLAAVPPRLFAVIVLTGLAMGLRNATVRGCYRFSSGRPWRFRCVQCSAGLPEPVTDA